MILPVFTLPIFLLPEGNTRIRVFEPRYLKLVCIASQNDGFVLYHGKKEEDSIGSHVDIVNFEQGEDGVLIIDVNCRSLVNLSNFEKDDQDLTFADAHEVLHWKNIQPEQEAYFEYKKDDVSTELSVALKDVFEENTTLREIYNHEFKEDPIWVVARWIEILPVKFADKRSFLHVDSFSKAKSFVHSVVIEQQS